MGSTDQGALHPARRCSRLPGGAGPAAHISVPHFVALQKFIATAVHFWCRAACPVRQPVGAPSPSCTRAPAHGPSASLTRDCGTLRTQRVGARPNSSRSAASTASRYASTCAASADCRSGSSPRSKSASSLCATSSAHGRLLAVAAGGRRRARAPAPGRRRSAGSASAPPSAARGASAVRPPQRQRGERRNGRRGGRHGQRPHPGSRGRPAGDG